MKDFSMTRMILTSSLFLLILTPFVQAETIFKPYDRNLSGYEYPYPVKFFEFTAQGQSLRMAYMDVKPVNHPTGKVVVLLHGKNFSGSYWESTIRELAASGYRVIVPDQIGFGKSTKPEHLQYTFQALAQWTRSLLSSLDVKQASIVGHSMGGMLATRFSLMYPEFVSKLVLVNPIGLEDWKTVVPYRSVDDWYKSELSLTPDKIRTYQAKAYFDGKWKPEYDKAIIPQAGWTLHPDYPCIAWNSALTYDMVFTQPVVYEFQNLKVPTLLLIGTRDRTALGKNLVTDPAIQNELGRYDRLGKATAQRIPGAKLVEFEGVGHLPQVEVFNPYITALKDFLK